MKLVVSISFLITSFCVLLLADAPAHAQRLACAVPYQFCGLCADKLWPGTFRVEQIITILARAYVRPVRPAACVHTGEARCPECEKAAAAAAGMPTVSEPISLATGNTFIKQADISLAGLGGGLSLTRTWNSQWPASQATYQNFGMFGPNWRSTYEESVFQDDDDGYIRYSRSDGNFWSLGYSDFGDKGPRYGVAAPALESTSFDSDLVSAKCVFTMNTPGGDKRVFTNCPYSGGPVGKLSSIIDRNGNTTTLHYDGAGRLDVVTDPVGRHLNFNYGTGALNYLVISVTLNTSVPADNVSYTYNYDTNTPPRLIKVTRPDNTYITFDYDATYPLMISAVKDQNSKILESHTYDSLGRGTLGSEASDVNKVTITYPTQ